MDHEQPGYRSPCEVGEDVTVYGTIAVSNDAGGTHILEHDGSGIVAKVTRKFWDYETGWRFHGAIADAALVEEVRRQATTGFTPDHYREKYPGNPDLAAGAEKAQREFDPAKVYFSEHDLSPSPGARPR